MSGFNSRRNYGEAEERRPTVTPEARSVFRGLSGEMADRYVAELLVPSLSRAAGVREPKLETLREALMDAHAAFRVILCRYAFSRRGAEGVSFADLALEALSRTLGDSSFEDYLESNDAEALWLSFYEVCSELGQKPLEHVDRPLLEGLAALNSEIYRQRGEANIYVWLREEVEETHRVDYLFERIMGIRNLGPKTASHFLRDAAFLFDFESLVHYADRLYLQPISSLLRRISRYVVPEASEEKLADWVLAGKIAKYARLAGVSGVRFNMGAAYFAAHEVEKAGQFDEAIRRLVVEGGPNAPD